MTAQLLFDLVAKRRQEDGLQVGLAVMNAPKPNSSAALDLLATMEAFDKYRNLRDAIFQHQVEEFAVIFNTEVDPILITIRAKGGTPLLVKVSESSLVDDPFLHDPVLCERGSCPEFESWLRSGQKARLCYEYGGDVWGLALMDNILVESLIPFLEKIENKKNTENSNLQRVHNACSPRR
jgi:hypothetical protein